MLQLARIFRLRRTSWGVLSAFLIVPLCGLVLNTVNPSNGQSPIIFIILIPLLVAAIIIFPLISAIAASLGIDLGATALFNYQLMLAGSIVLGIVYVGLCFGTVRIAQAVLTRDRRAVRLTCFSRGVFQ